jgi:HK97 family phage prohead protease
VEKIFKSASQSVDDPLQFVLSDDSTDRMGDTIQVTGWDLTNFKENPIALWAHAATRPIGRWVDVRVVGNKLMGKLVFADAGTSPMIDEIRSLVEQRILKTVSVGFNPLDAEPIRDPKGKMTGFNFIKQELLEVSLVAVPANPNAVAVARSLHLSNDTMKLCFDAWDDKSHRKSHSPSHGASAVKLRKAIAAAQAVLGSRK